MTFPHKRLRDLEELTDRLLLTRVDFNVPLGVNRQVEDPTRLRAVESTLRYTLEQGARPVLMSHLGRPGGEPDPSLSLKPVVEPLSEMLDCPVTLAEDCVGTGAHSLVETLSPGEVGLLENLRFHPGEEENCPDFSRELAELGDVYVNDAFGASHRTHASITGVPNHLKPAVAGDLMESEYEVLTEVRDNPERPFVVLMGGAKISDKFPLIKQFLHRADHVIVAGAMANTFMLAEDGQVGDSLVDREMIGEAKTLLQNRDNYRGELHLLRDVVAMKAANPSEPPRTFPAGEIPEGWKSMDIGEKTLEAFKPVLERAALVFWNGPMGVFEEERFARGTRKVITMLSESSARVVVGGGDSAAAVNQMGLTDSFYHVSTGGGASLSLVESGTLPGLDALDDPVRAPGRASDSRR